MTANDSAPRLVLQSSLRLCIVIANAAEPIPLTTIKANHTLSKEYHAALATYAAHEAEHEGALETAFSNLLATTAKSAVGWTLIPNESLRVGDKSIIPDGTLRDGFFRRGYWEAKDVQEDLDKEIRNKKKSNYPLFNTIFEDTWRAVL